jgi:hypothetical protein
MGVGCERDEAQARRWLQSARSQGLVTNQNAAGVSVPDLPIEEAIEGGGALVEFETDNQLNIGKFFNTLVNLSLDLVVLLLIFIHTLFAVHFIARTETQYFDYIKDISLVRIIFFKC